MPETKTQTDDSPKKTPFLGLSLTQLVGGGAAAATAALLGSRLGTTGTIIGAGVASIISAIASALYTASITRTRQAVVVAREMLPTTMALRRPNLPDVADQPEGTDDDVADVDEVEVVEEKPSLWSRVRWPHVVVATIAVFVVGAALITGIEAVTGHSVSGGGRTTFGNVVDGSSGQQPTPTPSKQPSNKATATDSSTPTQGTSSSATPTQTPTETATSTPTQTPTDQPTEQPTDQPTDGAAAGTDGAAAGAGGDSGTTG